MQITTLNETEWIDLWNELSAFPMPVCKPLIAVNNNNYKNKNIRRSKPTLKKKGTRVTSCNAAAGCFPHF
jgi:hypothetical protein